MLKDLLHHLHMLELAAPSSVVASLVAASSAATLAATSYYTGVVAFASAGYSPGSSSATVSFA